MPSSTASEARRNLAANPVPVAAAHLDAPEAKLLAVDDFERVRPLHKFRFDTQFGAHPAPADWMGPRWRSVDQVVAPWRAIGT